MDAPINISPEQTDTPVYLADPTAPTVTPSPEVSEKRAQKASMGVGSVLDKSKEDFRQSIQAGMEEDLRYAASSRIAYQNAQAVDQKLIDLRRSYGRPLSYQELIKEVDPYSPDNQAKTDIDSVLERAYADKFTGMMSTAANYLKTTYLDNATAEIPDQTKAATENASRLTTHLEIAKKFKQDNDAEIAQQGWIPWTADQAKTMFQPYNEWMMRGLNPDVSRLGDGFLLGDNVKAQADALFNRPTPDYIAGLKSIKEQLKGNPTLFSQFLDYILSPSELDRKLNNVFTILAPTDYASGFNISKSFLRRVELSNRVNNGFKQVVAAAAKSDSPTIPVKAVAQEAAGDIHGAAGTRAADHATRAITGNLDPVQDIKESFTSNYRLDGDLLDSNPGNLSTDELTKLKNSFYAAGESFYNTIINLLRVNRTTVPLEDTAAFKAYQDAARAAYPGENILDIGSPIYMRETNTYHIPFYFGNAEGRLLSDPETAYNYARNRGYADPRVLEATGEVEKSPGGLSGTKTDLFNKVRLEQSIPRTKNFLENLKFQASKKFVGPSRPEDIKALKETISSTQDIIDRYAKQLADINKRVITTEPVIEQNGVGYRYVVLRPYKETDDVVRSYLTSAAKSQSSSSMTGWSAWKNSALGWIRSADDTLAYNDTLNRKIATYTQTALRQWAKAEAANIEKISNQVSWYKPWTYSKAFTNKEMFQQFNETLKFAKTLEDRDGVPGRWFKTPGEIQDHYMRYYNRMPSFPEIEAYFSHVKLYEANRVLSEIAEFRNRARIGTEQHQIMMLAKDGSQMASGYFDGIHQPDFPTGGGELLVMGSHQGDERLYNLGANEISPKTIQKLREGVEAGKLKVIRIYDPDSHPLKSFSDIAGNNRVRYIITSNSESKPLGFNHVTRRGGGHFDVDSDWYIKQADVYDEFASAGPSANDKRKLFKKIYRGDKTLMPISNRALGSDIARMMTEMNGHMQANRLLEAQNLSRKLGIDWDTVQKWYDTERYVNGVKQKPFIDWNEPFYVVPRNRKIYDIDKGLEDRIGKQFFQDGTVSGSDARQFQVAYNQARDSELMHTIQDVGTQGNPLYRFIDAPYVDPIPSLNRALTRAINSTFMDDYKIQAVEHWLQEAMPHLKEDEKVVRSAPFYYFNNANKGAFKSATPNEVVDNFLSNHFKIKQFLGMPNKVETSIHGLTQQLVDDFYRRFGPEEGRSLATKAITIVPLWALSKWQDPISGIRSFAFNAKLGLFAVPQFLVQAQTFANIWALGGSHSAAGTFATMLHQWSRVNKSERFMQAYDDLYSKLNMFGSKAKPGEFLEANRELAKTGFEHVGGEYQLADDQMQGKFIQSQFNNFLSAGQVFFREGEKATRLGAYYTAFREFRHSNPTKVLTDADRAAILNRADIMTANMSRASASALNQSIFSLPMQFLTYQVRMGELFFGKRLGGTTYERTVARARLLGTYAALYGAPGALGVTGYPFSDSLREAAINKGYVPGDSQWQDAVMNGLVSWQLALISGGFDYKKGNQYDVQGRWGTQGMSVFRESMRSDKSIWSLVGGAGVDTILSTIGNLDPFWQFARQLVTNDEEGNTFRLTSSHFLNLFSGISSFDNAKRTIYAINTGRWLSQNQSYIEDVTAKDALFRAVTGFHSQDQSDIMALHDIKNSEEAVQKSAEKEIINEYRRGLDATRDKDYETAKIYFTNARALIVASGLPLERRTAVFAAASRGYEPQTMTSEWNWATKNVPYGQAPTRLDAISRRQQIQQYRNQ